MNITDQTFVLESITKTERKIWLMAYTTNQPQPNGSSIGESGPEHSIYWACCAVYHFRGIDRTPSKKEITDMFEHIKKTSK